MKKSQFAGAAIAALIATGLSLAASSALAETSSAMSSVSVSAPVDGFYAARPGRSLWTTAGSLNDGGRALIAVLQRAGLDGLSTGPDLADRATALSQRAASGDRAAAQSLERLLSASWVRYVQAIQKPIPGMDYADAWAAPRRQTPAQILSAAASSASLAAHVAKVSAVNPVYAQLRDDAWAEVQQAGGSVDPRTLRSLAAARTAPSQGRYILVDAQSANLWMIDNGQIVGSMPVITGDSQNETPMIASTIYHATLNPYWNVPSDLTRTLIAPRVIDQGLTYLTDRNYEVLSSYARDAQPIDPASVDWAAVAAGKVDVKLRRKPGEWNSMGQMKFGFPNDSDIFLHDTPEKDKFALEQRKLSHGCIRLSDARTLARWLLGRDPDVGSASPEQHVALPTPVPIYVTHLDARVDGGRVALAHRASGRSTNGTQVASLR